MPFLTLALWIDTIDIKKFKLPYIKYILIGIFAGLGALIKGSIYVVLIAFCMQLILKHVNYIRFAVEEPNLFRFLFQSGFVSENSLLEMVNSEELIPVLSAMQEEMNRNMEQTKEIFITLAMFVHGYASIIANNAFTYDEQLISKQLERVYTGAVLAIQEKEK